MLETLPNEILLKVLSYLEIEGIIHCSQVSKRIREISCEEILWQKINLYKNLVPINFLSMILNRGCKYLSLNKATV